MTVGMSYFLNLRNACSGIFAQKSSDDPNRPCCNITALFLLAPFLFGEFRFELQRNTVKIYPSSVIT